MLGMEWVVRAIKNEIVYGRFGVCNKVKEFIVFSGGGGGDQVQHLEIVLVMCLKRMEKN